ncbi:SHOCT domain-containing protein [Actinomadura formosensis]|uniref:SHOCT domain-containing protein n=1 Tax=Actinomadura formosensis TaxID=60706 RepID=UPI00082EB93D|nr:SHOCT domain-containing protein [Actinomadura formosensis]
MLTTLAAQAAALHPGPWQDGDAPAFWPVFPITFGLFWLAVLGTAFYLIRRRMNSTAASAAAAADPLARARAVLAERFARGEIDEEEYLMRTSTLRNGD